MRSETELAAAGKALTSGEDSLTAFSKRLADWTHALDPTRPVTANMVLPIVSYYTGYAQVQDVAGMSYRAPIYDRARLWEPKLWIIGNEN